MLKADVKDAVVKALLVNAIERQQWQSGKGDEQHGQPKVRL
jgi:hypothetical protein